MTSPPERTPEAANAAHKPGRTLYSSAEWQRLGDALQLSPRELEILQAVFDDMSEPAIAKQLQLSVHTVHTYIKRLLGKLHAHSRVEVVCKVVAIERKTRKGAEQLAGGQLLGDRVPQSGGT